MATFEVVRRARKARTCSSCQDTIPAGTRYRRWVATPGDVDVNNTGWWHQDECPACAERRGQPIPGELGPQASAVDAWNRNYRIGHPVRYWPGFRPGPSYLSKTRTPAQLLGFVAVVWVDDEPAAITLDFITPGPLRTAP